MPKIHRCPECGRSHTGFTEKCRDCYYGSYPVALAASVQDAKETQDHKPVLRNCVTKRRGRPRVHKDNAERQKAYRGRR